MDADARGGGGDDEVQQRADPGRRAAGQLDGLHSQSEGVRVTFAADGKRSVIDGPFTEAKEVIGGYWIIQVKSKDEAVEWASRCPQNDCAVEVRQIFEMDEFPPEVQAADGRAGSTTPVSEP